MPREVVRIADLGGMVGTELGVSSWYLIDQARISGFADVTEDHQYIHVDPERAAHTASGGTIAHGFLPLSMLSVMFEDVTGGIEGASMSMNYGFEAVRFISPVPCGSRIRARFHVQSYNQRGTGQWRLGLVASVEIEGADKPALVARWLVLLMAAS